MPGYASSGNDSFAESCERFDELIGWLKSAEADGCSTLTWKSS